MALTVIAQAPASDTAQAALRVARKQAEQARGKVGDAKTAELSKALAAYRDLLERWPDARAERALSFFEMSEIHKRLGETEAALRSIDESLAIEGETRAHAPALELKASILKKEKDFAGAERALEDLIEGCASETARVARAHLGLASLARRQKKWDVALQWCDRLLSEFPGRWRDSVDACNAALGVLIEQREWVKAIARLDELDRLLEERFASTELWPRVRKAMDGMSSRRTLTPVGAEAESAEKGD